MGGIKDALAALQSGRGSSVGKEASTGKGALKKSGLLSKQSSNTPSVPKAFNNLGQTINNALKNLTRSNTKSTFASTSTRTPTAKVVPGAYTIPAASMFASSSDDKNNANKFSEGTVTGTGSQQLQSALSTEAEADNDTGQSSWDTSGDTQSKEGEEGKDESRELYPSDTTLNSALQAYFEAQGYYEPGGRYEGMDKEDAYTQWADASYNSNGEADYVDFVNWSGGDDSAMQAYMSDYRDYLANKEGYGDLDGELGNLTEDDIRAAYNYLIEKNQIDYSDLANVDRAILESIMGETDARFLADALLNQEMLQRYGAITEQDISKYPANIFATDDGETQFDTLRGNSDIDALQAYYYGKGSGLTYDDIYGDSNNDLSDEEKDSLTKATIKDAEDVNQRNNNTEKLLYALDSIGGESADLASDGWFADAALGGFKDEVLGITDINDLVNNVAGGAADYQLYYGDKAPEGFEEVNSSDAQDASLEEIQKGIIENPTDNYEVLKYILDNQGYENIHIGRRI